ncbi:MAG: sulfite exporter TauE/SafE family protein [Candidatus Geothermincolia bacterium]
MALFFEALLAVIVGVATGMLSGAFGIGGGFLTTPAIRLLLGGSAAAALGTPLLVIFPTALAGALNYSRAHLINRRAFAAAAPSGVVGSLAGSFVTRYINLEWLMLVTGVFIVFLALKTAHKTLRGGSREPASRSSRDGAAALAAIGLVAGFVAGLLGVGGGVILIPAFVYLAGIEIKEAIGTSLLCITAMAVPGSIVHYLLGHVDLGLFALLALGVVPGSYLGSRFTIGARERLVMLLFAVLLLAIGIIFVFTELRVLF